MTFESFVFQGYAVSSSHLRGLHSKGATGVALGGMIIFKLNSVPLTVYSGLPISSLPDIAFNYHLHMLLLLRPGLHVDTIA
jgi:hypothetical protein